MDTTNNELRTREANRKYYSHSDGHFISEALITNPDLIIDRMKWLFSKVQEVGSKTHVAIGCKDGYEVLMLRSAGIEAVGYEPSVDAVEKANERAEKLNWGKIFTVSFAEDIPEGVKADSVSCMEVIEHVLDVDALLKKLFSIGTYVMISTPEASGRHGLEDSKKNKEHLRIFTQRELEDKIKQYAEIVSSDVRDDQICICAKSLLK